MPNIIYVHKAIATKIFKHALTNIFRLMPSSGSFITQYKNKLKHKKCVWLSLEKVFTLRYF